MPAALKLLARRMTVAGFLDRVPDEGSGRIWQLRDGVPEMIAPSCEPLGAIQARLCYLLIGRLDAVGSACRVVIAAELVRLAHRTTALG